MKASFTRQKQASGRIHPLSQMRATGVYHRDCIRDAVEGQWVTVK